MDDYDPTWWQHIFDETYLITDARTVCCPETTAAEINMVEATLGLRPDDRILDLCGGQGRHAIELHRRGYKKVTVVDYSQVLLRVGVRQMRQESNVESIFVEAMPVRLDWQMAASMWYWSWAIHSDTSRRTART